VSSQIAILEHEGAKFQPDEIQHDRTASLTPIVVLTWYIGTIIDSSPMAIPAINRPAMSIPTFTAPAWSAQPEVSAHSQFEVDEYVPTVATKQPS